MKKTLLIAVIILGWLVASCTTGRSVVSQNIDLSKYRYASIINNDTYHIPAELMEYEIQLYDAVECSGLQLVSDMRLYELQPQQREQLLLVKYGVSISEEKTVVTVNFIDYSTGRPVVSCSAATTSIVSYQYEMKGAIKNVANQIAKTFHK